MPKVNVKFLIVLLVAIVVLGIGVHVLHIFQADRIAQALLWQAQHAQEEGHSRQAAKFLSRYLEFAPKDNEVRIQLADTLEPLAATPRQRAQVYLILDQALRAQPERQELRRRLVPMAMALGRTPDAVAHLQVLLQAAPEDGELENLLGQCQESTGQFTEAAQLYESALRHKPDHVSSYVQLAYVLRRRLNQPDQADQIMNELVKTNPQVYQAFLARGRYRQQFDKSPTAADKDFAQALQLAPNEAEVLLANAEAAQERKDRKAAREYLERGCQLHPQEVRMYQGLAWLALWDKDQTTALRWVRQGLEAVPNQRELLWTLADILIQGGDPKDQAEARTVIARLGKSGYPASAIEYLNASLLVRNQQWAEGAQLLERNRSQAAASPQLSRQTDLLLGQCYEHLDEADRQYDAYRRVLASDPSSILARQGLAAALASMGKLDEAIVEYQKLPSPSQTGVATSNGSLAIARLSLLRNLRLPPEQRKWEGVQDLLTKAEKENPDTVEATLLWVELFAAQKQFSQARALLEKRFQTKQDQVELWIARASLAQREQDDSQAALRVLADAEKKVGDLVQLRLARARYLSDRRESASVKDLQDLVANKEKFSSEDQVRLLNGLGETLYRSGQQEEARRLWTQAAEKRPNDLRIRVVLLDVALQTDNQPELQRVLNDIRRIEGENGVLWSFGEARRLLGLAKKGNPQYLADARALLDSVASRRPSWPAVALCRAEIDEVQGDAETAIGNYKQAIQAGERNPYGVTRLVHLLVERNRYDEADQLLREMERRNSLPSSLRKLAAEVAVQTKKDPPRALQMVQQAVAADTKDYQEYLWLGQMLFTLKNKNDEAEKALRQAIQLAEKNPETWLALVKFQSSTAQRDQAKKTLQEAQRKLPPDQAQLALAQGYEVIGSSNQLAQNHYEAAFKANPSDARTLRLVADYYLRTSQTLKAIPLLQSMIASKQQRSQEDIMWARRSLALSLAFTGDYSQFHKALDLLAQNLQAGGTLDDQRARAAVLATQKSRRLVGTNETARRQAIRLVEDLVQQNKANSEDRFLLAQLYEGEGDWNKAKAKMLDLISLQDKKPHQLAHCASSFLRQGLVVEAQMWLTELEKLDRDSLLTLSVRARLLEAQGKSNEAIDLIAKMVEKPDDTQTARLFFAATLLDELNQTSAARKLSVAAEKLAAATEKHYRAYIAQKPKEIHRFVNFLSRQGRLREALDLCETAWKSQDPEQSIAPELIAGTALAALRAGNPTVEQFQRVDGWLKAALEKKPQQVGLLVNLADLRDLQGHFDEAEKLYRQVLERDDRNLVALNNLAWLLAQRSAKNSEALTLINRAIDVVGPLGELLDTRAVVQLSQDRIEAAIEDLQDAIRETPTASCYFHLARAHQQAKNREAALSAFQQAKASKLEVNNLHPLERGAFRQLLGELEQR